jgi:hypothetical protein
LPYLFRCNHYYQPKSVYGQFTKMNRTRPLLALLSLLFLAISLVLLWFVILSGITRTSPLRQTYFLRADTSGISGARAISQWTYFKVCGLDNRDCGPARPALPLGDAWDSYPSGAPAGLTGKYGGHTTSHYFWYMWRFGWVFFLLALFFETVAFFSGFLACLGRVGAAVSAMIASLALVMLSVGVALMTYVFSQLPFPTQCYYPCPSVPPQRMRQTSYPTCY